VKCFPNVKKLVSDVHNHIGCCSVGLKLTNAAHIGRRVVVQCLVTLLLSALIGHSRETSCCKAPLYSADGGLATMRVGDGKALAAARGGVPHARADGRGVR
jgi:hypothetical protein